MKISDCLTASLIKGTWYIVKSSLPMWRKSAGSISYCLLPDGSVGDIVASQKCKKVNHIVGIDRAIGDDEWQWEWRGVQPHTFFVRSRWRFVAGDSEGGWAVTIFEKTLFSAAGIDIYSRSPTIDIASLEAAMHAISQDLKAREYLAALFEPPLWQN